ncbi:ferredoxin reductase [Micromonospora phytophila]|uniref:ferredoxin reductase n=1 Tax=Micromonospora phytophila TaxID=709888 RepID=UPI002030951A|nr:ferredoxin reductase [Micromonospora phytophila]MCM0677953.1 ferredoxin reductase [Micromonospora phytophila]
MTTTVPRSSVRGSFPGRILRLAAAVTTPLLPEDYLDLVAPLRAGADLRGRILAVRPETPDAATLVIQPGRDWRGHVPGQYVRLGVDVDGVRQWRAYSVTSAPVRRTDPISVTVKAIPDGVVSNHLVRRARAGTIVQLDQAQGDFVLTGQPPARVLFVTAGSGITPVMGMLRAGALAGADVVLAHSAPTAADVIFAEELRGLADRGAVRLVQRHTDVDGMLGVDELDTLVPDHLDRETWACGPVGLLDALERHWASRGAAERLHTERFRPTVITPGEGGTVTFTGSGITVAADGATPILDAGEDAGVLMPSGCRMGICFGCVLPLRQGAVRDLRNGQLTTAVPGDGVRVQTCVSAAAGACELEI